MTPLAEHRPAEQGTDARVIGLVAAAHFVSHYYILVLPPLFTVIRADFDVSYTQLGIALTVFNVISALLQTPAGFLIDKVNVRASLVTGILLGSAGLIGAALLPSFWWFVTMYALLGLGNTVYHPADYSLLSRHVSPQRMGQAYSIHTFAGLLGGAVAPGSLILMAERYGWRTAFLGAALLGIVVAALIVVFGSPMSGGEKSTAPKEKEAEAVNVGWSLLLSGPVLLNLLFFVLIALANSGLQNYGVVALDAMRGTPLVVANAGLTSLLLMGAIGVLVGGALSMRTTKHGLVAATGLAVSAIMIVPIVLFDVGPALLIILFGIAGLANGIVMPSRDLLVRAVTPPGAFGKVFGFVTTGFNIGGMISPILYGWLLDNGSARNVFLVAIAFGIAAIPTVLVNAAQHRR
ncbi:MAG: MFS transporter [Rhizobiales bacterium]|nr:MFS transporter [Hyphomicrobiales bacterium]